MLKLGGIILKTTDIEKMKSFYEKLGFEFKREKHGGGPVHYSWKKHGMLLEIYPAQIPDNTGLIFHVDNLEDILSLLEFRGAKIISKPTDEERVSVIRDPEGRRVELRQI